MIKIINKFPVIKKILKNIYYIIGNIISDKKSSTNFRVVSNTDFENLFGYYDKSPWNKDKTKMIYVRCKDAIKNPNGGNLAYIILLDLLTNQEEIVGETTLWNTQQGSMLQWLGPDYNKSFIYNTLDQKGDYSACIHNTVNGSNTYIASSAYAISSNAELIYSLNFHKLGKLRPGYGYSVYSSILYENFNDNFLSITNLKLNQTNYYLSKSDLVKIKPLKSMEFAEHYINHIQVSQDNKSIVFLHRWIKNGVKYDRLLSISPDGRDLKVLLDDGMISHYNWISSDELIIYCYINKYGNGYYKFNLSTLDVEKMNIGFPTTDGHPSVSPNGRYIVTDTYPNFKRKQYIYIHDIKKNKTKIVAEVYLPNLYNNNCRVDLHPRWNWDSSQLCFDMVINKSRQVAVIDMEDNL